MIVLGISTIGKSSWKIIIISSNPQTARLYQRLAVTLPVLDKIHECQCGFSVLNLSASISFNFSSFSQAGQIVATRREIERY